MKPATVAARTALMESVEVRALPKLLAEWEHNRFSKIQQVNTDDENKIYVNATPPNDPKDFEWNGIYDVNAITLPNRPATGIAKARLSETIKLQSGYRDKPTEARFYLASDDDIYKYWSSTQRSKLIPVATNDYEFPTPITLTLMYEQPVIANKLVVGFDVSYARPKTYDIHVTADGTNWVLAGRNIVPNATTGQVVLWRASNGSESWGDVAVYDGPEFFKGIRLTVKSMNEPYSNLDVIQMGLRLENDLSEFVIGYSRGFEISERSFIAPLGKSSSNTASLELTNLDLRFNNDNEDSIYYGLIDKKVKFTLNLSVDARKSGGSADERFREFTMWADSWGGVDEDSVKIELKDSSVFLQEVNMPKVYWENMTVGAIIWQLMDTVGLTNYNYTRDVLDTGQVIPHFWSIEGTVWEQISELAEGTQTAVWFDEYDVMQIKTRKSVFGPGRTVSWNFDAVKNGNKLPDIENISSDDNMAVNQVDINWKPAEFQESKGFPVMETVWEPEEEDVVLRSTPLVRNLMVNEMEMIIKAADASHWPYESLVNIRGEVIRYRGKEYMYHDAGGARRNKIVASQEEKEDLDKLNENMAWANSFTGKLAITERGVGGSGTTTHYVKSAFYTGKATGLDDGFYWPLDLNNGGMFYNPDGTMTLQSVFSALAYFAVDHEAEISSAPNASYGTRLKFPTKEKNIRPDHACAGIRIDGDWGDTGYWIEISPTYIIEDTNRFFRHEVSLVRMPMNQPGVYVPVIGGDQRGVPTEILPEKWYDVDVRHTVDGAGNANIIVFINGQWNGAWFIPANLRPPSQRKNSLFVRGNCKCDFEYFYGINHGGEIVAGPDESSYLDLVSGGFTSGFIEREWRFGSYLAYNRGPARFGNWTAVSLNSRANYFFDEFGPVVHEMREFEVTFDEDKVPVGHSYLYFTSQDQVACLDYTSDAFGARFTLVNTMRRDAIVKGSDAVTLGEDNKIEQKIFIYGRTLSNPDDANKLTKKDEHSIRRKGTISLEFDNRWIQTQKSADDLGQWVLDQWATGVDEIKLSVFGNFLIQLGDLVTLNYPAKDYAPTTHKYYVVSLKNNFDKGLTTEIILRRARN